jgi:outer membrane protein OmpA-like peptidoglycan-associated protein
LSGLVSGLIEFSFLYKSISYILKLSIASLDTKVKKTLIMKKRRISTLAKLLFLILLVPILTWANCQQANRLFNHSLKVASPQKNLLLNQALSLCPTHLYTLNNLAVLSEKEGKFSEAQWLYSLAVEINPNFAHAYAGLGDVLMQLQDYQHAAEAFQKFLTLQQIRNDPTLQPYVKHYTQRLTAAQKKIIVFSPEIFKTLLNDLSKVDIPVNFADNFHKVKGKARQQPREIALAIDELFKTNGLQNSRIRIEGHTDNQGSATYNKELSGQWANKVKNILVKDFKVPANRLKVVGWGEEKPIATNKTVQGRFLNRRITLVRLDK